jgi:hypothetical protein
MAVVQQQRGDARPDESGASGNQDAQSGLPFEARVGLRLTTG